MDSRTLAAGKAQNNSSSHQVTLGVAGAYISSKNASGSDNDSRARLSKAGGVPDWWSPFADDDDDDGLVCACCGKPLALIAQVYAPIPTDRTLYVFACNSPCSATAKGWRVLRFDTGTAPPLDEQPTPTEQNKTEIDWGSGANNQDDGDDWGDDGDDGGDDQAYLTAELERMLSLNNNSNNNSDNNNNKEPPKAEQKQPTQTEGDDAACSKGTDADSFRSFYIVDEIEPLSDAKQSDKEIQRAKELLKQYELKQEQTSHINAAKDKTMKKKKNNNNNNGNGGPSIKDEWNEEYEVTGDMVFERFQRVMALAPYQCLRYCYDGRPLWAAGVVPPRASLVGQQENMDDDGNDDDEDEEMDDSVERKAVSALVGPCSLCGSERRYEMQLMPHLLQDLYESSNQDPKTRMEWTTVLVFACSESCNKGKYVQEACIVQSV